MTRAGLRALLPAAVLLMVLALQGCKATPSKEEEEIARNTFACQNGGERIVIRFDRGEVRLLLPGGDRVTLYEVPSASGQRYTNGSMELLGARGGALRLGRNGAPPEPLLDCVTFAQPPDQKL